VPSCMPRLDFGSCGPVVSRGDANSGVAVHGRFGWNAVIISESSYDMRGTTCSPPGDRDLFW
jgi:hypothetical protein